MIDKGKPAVVAGFFKMKASGVFDDADAAGLSHPVFMLFELLLRAKYPAKGRAHGGGNGWL